MMKSEWLKVQVLNYILRGPESHAELRLDTFSYFCRNTDAKEREVFLKKQHGEYSGSHSGNDNLTYTYAKLSFSHGSLGAPYAQVELKWPAITKRVSAMISSGTFLYPSDADKMAETDDAATLLSSAKYPMEIAYAEYANKMKSLANQARKTEYNTGKIEYSAKAKEIYKPEVDSLMSKLNIALLNAPRERQAQLKANTEINSKINAAKAAGEKLSSEDVKKASQRALSKYRTEVGSVSRRDRSIKITDREWEAIQAGAISEAKLKKILDNTDVDNLRERATPRTKNTASQAQINRMKALRSSNYTLDEIAKKVGLSPSAVSKYLKGVN